MDKSSSRLSEASPIEYGCRIMYDIRTSWRISAIRVSLFRSSWFNNWEEIQLSPQSRNVLGGETGRSRPPIAAVSGLHEKAILVLVSCAQAPHLSM